MILVHIADAPRPPTKKAVELTVISGFVFGSRTLRRVRDKGTDAT